MEHLADNGEAKKLVITIETLQTKQDFETVFQLIPSLVAYPELSFGFIPYLASSTISVIELLKKYGRISELDEAEKIDEKKIKDIRAKIKTFDTQYATSIRIIRNIEYIQDQIFKKSNRIYCCITRKPHPNLGIYVDETDRIIGNTHYSYYVMQDTKIVSKRLDAIKKLYKENPAYFSSKKNGQEAFRIANDIGQIVGSILSGLDDLFIESNPTVEDLNIHVFYSDVNTDHRDLFTQNTIIDKSIFLYILHILTSINFVLYVVNMCDKNDTGWWLKTNYMAYFYCVSRLRDLEKFYSGSCSNSQDLSDLFKELSLKDENLLIKEFRNCIMHASFSKDGIILINNRYFDIKIPLFGLVETYFEGMSYSNFKLEIISRLSRISNILSKWLGLSLSKTLIQDNSKRKRISVEELRPDIVKPK